jgi:hypothetical protein
MAEKIGIDDVVEQAAAGVLRAMEARAAGRAASTAEYVQSGFRVECVIRAGGYPPYPWPYDGTLTADPNRVLSK